ncbi:hypothetical protein JYB62_13230 [Algoriphagus lutimaris]|uniref:DUF6090 family protein n=1 Tax=Algoriphagus lutimaris TaxID=613197 RepID=UPI00196A46E5|nr:DUF6090 family protein [Algoriphagus lutimaris]MBN3520965.1 hypothetical protein [Algoriphagus lutimaris]
MISFFRKIRQKLLRESKVTRYLIYALGEIILVTIGILIALQINTWNTNRLERIQEQAVLKQLKEEFESNLEQIDLKIALRDNIISNATEVLHYIDSKMEVSKDTLFQKMSPIVMAPTFDPIQNDILQSEKIQLIRNEQLRRILANWPTYVTELKEQEEEWVKIYNNFTSPYLIEIGLSRDLNLYFYDNPKNLKYLMDINNSKEISLSNSKRSPSVMEILNDIKIEGILSNAVLINIGVNWESETLRDKILKILELIEGQIIN